MSLYNLDKTHIPGAGDLAQAVRELQGLNAIRVTGAAANTKINVAAMRTEDTVLYAEYVPTTFANPTVLSDLIIQDTRASGTVTFASAVNADTFAVNGITYTVKTTPTADTHVLLGGTDAQMATKAAAIVNAKEKARNANNASAPQVIASSTGSTGVLTFTSIADGAGNGPIVTGTVTVLAAAGSGTASATLTCATVVNGNTFVVNGVTFTAKTTPVAGVLTDVALAAGADNTLQAAIIANAINAYDNAHGFSPHVVATSALAVVTIVAEAAKTGNTIPLAGTVTRLAASGATLAGGTATGGFKTATNTSAGTVMLFWFNKR